MAKKNGKTRAKAATADVPVPQSREDVARDIAAIGERIRARALLETGMAAEIAAVRERFEAEAQPIGAEIVALSKGVEIWCSVHRQAITEGGKRKTVAFSTGEVRWRMTPASVSVRNVEAVLETLRALQLTRLIRVKEEVNKEAILAEPDAVRGVAWITISQREEFEVLPHADELAPVSHGASAPLPTQGVVP
jgi:phage host-nuclease inhibitor protein Gam